MKVKVKVCIMREVEMDINEPALAELDNYWRTRPCDDWKNCSPALIVKAVDAVEAASGCPFGDQNAPETIIAVLAMDKQPILEW